MRFHDYFNVYNILIDEEISQNFKQVKICLMYISDKFLKFSVNKLFKFRHISKIKYVYCVVHVAIQTLF